MSKRIRLQLKQWIKFRIIRYLHKTLDYPFPVQLAAWLACIGMIGLLYFLKSRLMPAAFFCAGNLGNFA